MNTSFLSLEMSLDIISDIITDDDFTLDDLAIIQRKTKSFTLEERALFMIDYVLNT